MNLWTQFVLILAVAMSYTWADKMRLRRAILNEIFRSYDRRDRPLGENGTGPVVVQVNNFVRRLSYPDDVSMVYTAQLNLRMQWLDERLKYNGQGINYLTLTNPDQIWIPDLFFSNEMEGHFHKILTPNNLIRIFPDGTIFYSTRISLELFCPMNLKNYPMDKQICRIVAASYGYTTSDLLFIWKRMDPVQMSKNLYLPKFSLDAFVTDYCTSKTNTGEYSCLMLEFHFSRKFIFHLLQDYMPTMSLVILSWIAFWVHPRSVSIRLGIWTGVLLSMIIVTTSVAERGPRVSYIKAIDVWMGTCVVFLFCVLIEMGFVNSATTKDDYMRLKNEVPLHKVMDSEDGMNNSNRLPHFTIMPLRWLNKYSTQGQRIDVVSRFLFPAAFAIFNLVYWCTYISESEDI